MDHQTEAPNANVYFEMGYAQGVSDGKRHLLFARRGTTLPFDIIDRRVNFWTDEKDFEELCFKAIGDVYRKIRAGEE